MSNLKRRFAPFKAMKRQSAFQSDDDEKQTGNAP
jgi:hypothetical protein